MAGVVICGISRSGEDESAWSLQVVADTAYPIPDSRSKLPFVDQYRERPVVQWQCGVLGMAPGCGIFVEQQFTAGKPARGGGFTATT